MQASPLNCAHPSPQFNGHSSNPADKRGVWGAKRPSPSGRRPAGGQGAKPPITNKASSRSALVRARSERPIQGVRFQFPWPQITSSGFILLAPNATDKRQTRHELIKSQKPRPAASMHAAKQTRHGQGGQVFSGFRARQTPRSAAAPRRFSVMARRAPRATWLSRRRPRRRIVVANIWHASRHNATSPFSTVNDNGSSLDAFVNLSQRKSGAALPVVQVVDNGNDIDGLQPLSFSEETIKSYFNGPTSMVFRK